MHRQNNNPYTHLTRKELHRKGKQNRLGQYIMSIYVYEDIVLIACIARAAYEEYNLIHILVMRWASHLDTTPATHPAPHPPPILCPKKLWLKKGYQKRVPFPTNFPNILASKIGPLFGTSFAVNIPRLVKRLSGGPSKMAPAGGPNTRKGDLPK